MPGECMPFCGLSPSLAWQKGRRRERDRQWEEGGGLIPSRATGQIGTPCFSMSFLLAPEKKNPSSTQKPNETTYNVYQNIISLGVAAVGLKTCPKWGACDILSRLPQTHLHRSTTSSVASTRAGVLELLVYFFH